MSAKKRVSVAISARLDNAFKTQLSSASDQIKKLGQSSLRINSQLKSLDSFKKASKNLSELRSQALETSKAHELLSKDFSDSHSKLTKLKKSVKDLKLEDSKLRLELKSDKLALQQARSECKKFSKSLKSSKLKSSAFTAKLKESEKAVGRFSHKILETEKRLSKNKASLNSESEALSQSAKETGRKSSELSVLEKQLLQTRRAIDREESSLGNLSKTLKSSGIDTQKLSKEQERLTRSLSLSDKGLRRLKRSELLSSRVSTLKSEISSKATGLAVGGASLGVLGFPAVSFEDKMASVGALTNAGETTFKNLSQLARDMGKQGLFTSSQIADAQGFLAMAGFNPKEISGALKGVIDLAAAGKMDLAQTADISSNILSGYSLKADKMGKVADTLAATATSSNVDVSMLGETLKYVAPISSQAGSNLNIDAAAAGLLGNVGIQDSMAGTTLRAIYNRLAAPSTAAQKELLKMGISTKDKDNNLRLIPDILKDIASSLKGVGSAKKLDTMKSIFGEEAAAGSSELVKQAGTGNLGLEVKKLNLAPAYINMLNSIDDLNDETLAHLNLSRKALKEKDRSQITAFIQRANKSQIKRIFSPDDVKNFELIAAEAKSSSFESLIEKLNKVSSAHDLAERRNGKTSKALKKLSSAANSAGIAIGSVVLPEIANMVTKLASALSSVASLAEENPKLTKSLLYGAGAFGLIRTASLAYSVVSFGLTKGLQGATLAQRAFNTATKASVIGLAVTAVSLLVSYSKELTEAWNHNIDRINEFAQTIRDMPLLNSFLDFTGIQQKIDLSIGKVKEEPTSNKITHAPIVKQTINFNKAQTAKEELDVIREQTKRAVQESSTKLFDPVAI